VTFKRRRLLYLAIVQRKANKRHKMSFSLIAYLFNSGKNSHVLPFLNISKFLKRPVCHHSFSFWERSNSLCAYYFVWYIETTVRI